jgi:DNA polymerase-3 subunit delta'
MVLDQVVGQDRIKSFLRAALQSRRVPHALLFHGPEGVGKHAAALAMAQALLCDQDPLGCGDCAQCRRVARFTHPDVTGIFPAPKNISEKDERSILDQWSSDPYRRQDPWPSATISIERIRTIRYDAGMKSFEGGARVTLVADADRMRPEAANALLKILEEPPPRTYFILISSRPNALLPTIVSRCQQVRFDPLPETVIAPALMSRCGLEESRANSIARLACGSFRRALEMLDEDIQARRDRAVELLRQSLRDEYEQVEYVEKLVEAEDLDSLRELLIFVTLWLRDAMLLQTLGEKASGLANEDTLDTLQRFVEALPQIDYEGAVHEVEQSLAWLGRNVHMKLVLMVLLRRLRACFRR